MKVISISSGMLYLYFAIFSGIPIMPLKNLDLYWNNWIIYDTIMLFNTIISKIKSVSILNMFKYIITFKYYRDFKQELLLLNYLYIVKFLFLKDNYLIVKTRFYHTIDSKGKLSKTRVLND